MQMTLLVNEPPTISPHAPPDAARIARACLVPPATIGQRLSRAKAKIRTAGPRLTLPAAGLTADRPGHVRGAVCAACPPAREPSTGTRTACTLAFLQSLSP